jgi:hypothetical protein
MTAYVVTCHKMQGGECDVIVIILHEAHRAMLYREWLYTAVTRASQKCILLYKEDALRTALNKQKMKGSTLRQKVLSFAEQQGISEEGLRMGKEVRLPASDSSRNRILDRVDEATTTPARLTTDAERSGGLMSLLKRDRERKAGATPPTVEPEVRHRIITEVVNRTVFETRIVDKPEPKPDPVDGGDLTPWEQRRKREQEILEGTAVPATLPAPAPQLPAPPVAKSLPWAAAWIAKQSEPQPRLLTFTETPVAKVPPRNPFARRA